MKRPDLGNLSVGAEADIAVLKLERGDFGFVDSGWTRMRGDSQLNCHMTIRAGEILWDLNGLSRPWLRRPRGLHQAGRRGLV